LRKTMTYLKLWFTVYINPRKFSDELAISPAPCWGFFAALQRGLMDSLLIYLPMCLLRRVPPTRSYLSFIPDEKYYGALLILGPIVLLAEWLLSSSLMHLILRLGKRFSDFDKVLNVSGFSALAIGSVLILWDALWLLTGGMNQYSLGISHLLIDLWAIAIATIALKRILKVPIWLGILLNIIGIIVSMPLAIMFMRSPL
jgi:hypothetical protein